MLRASKSGWDGGAGVEQPVEQNVAYETVRLWAGCHAASGPGSRPGVAELRRHSTRVSGVADRAPVARAPAVCTRHPKVLLVVIRGQAGVRGGRTPGFGVDVVLRVGEKLVPVLVLRPQAADQTGSFVYRPTEHRTAIDVQCPCGSSL